MKAKYINEFDEPGVGSVYNKLGLGMWHGNPKNAVDKLKNLKEKIDKDIQDQSNIMWEIFNIEFNKEYSNTEFDNFINFMSRGYYNINYSNYMAIDFDVNSIWFDSQTTRSEKTIYNLYAEKILIVNSRIYTDNGTVVNKLYGQLPKINGTFGATRPICEFKNIITV